MEDQQHQALWPQMVAALAEIDAALGLPEDGCNSTGRTLAAVRELKDRATSAQQQAQALARAVMADQTAHDTWTRNALRYQLLLDGPHNFGVFVCGPEGEPDDSISNEELTAALDSMLGAEDDRAREWIESEETMRGAPLQEVLRSPCATVIWHRSKPDTTNPVWEVIGQ